MSLTAPTYDEFIERFSNFSDMPKTSVEVQLALSEELFAVDAWGTWFSEAVNLDAAHNLYLQQQACRTSQGAGQGTAGPVTSVSAAGVSISFDSPKWNDKSQAQNWYMKTIYGQQFLRLQQVVIPMGILTA